MNNTPVVDLHAPRPVLLILAGSVLRYVCLAASVKQVLLEMIPRNVSRNPNVQKLQLNKLQECKILNHCPFFFIVINLINIYE